jgi:hypothetical protein
MHGVTDLSDLGPTPGRASELPPGCVPARVFRLDRGRLSVVSAEGEARVRPVAALDDGAGPAGPAVRDRAAVRVGLAVAVLTRTGAFVRPEPAGRPLRR